MKNLISMTDFVLENENLLERSKEVLSKDLIKLNEYAYFLKQPLELWMFVSCDKDGDFLETPFVSQYFDEYLPVKNMIYQKAKERCLFEGFVVQNTKDWIEFYGGIRVYIPSNDLGNTVSLVFRESEPINKTIEGLVKYNLILTPTALKQLGL